MNLLLFKGLANLAPELGSVFLKFFVAKYIEHASDPSEMVSRAKALTALASQADTAVLSGTSVHDLTSATEAEIVSKQGSVSNQILVSSLIGLLATALPDISTDTLIGAAGKAMADQFLKDIIAVCNLYTASPVSTSTTA